MAERAQIIVNSEYTSSLKRVLYSMALEESRMGGKRDFVGSRVLTPQYDTSGLFENTYTYFNSWAASGEKTEISDIKKAFAGRVFEDYAFAFESRKHLYPNVVLPPDKTFLFFQCLYHDRPVSQGFVGPLIKDISVPDGLLVRLSSEAAEIVGTYEYTLQRDSETQYFQNKYDASKERIKKIPKFFNKPDLIFVVPSGTEIKIKLDSSPDTDFGKVISRKLFFSREQFRGYAEALWDFYMIEDLFLNFAT